MKFENEEIFNFEGALRGMRNGVRKTKNNKFETYVSINGKSKNLGTYDTEKQARTKIYHHYKSRLEENTDKLGLHNIYCKMYKNKYVVFENGIIVNIYGKEMKGCIDHCGYREIIINGKLERVHRIIATCFIENQKKLPCVNHKDGNKLNNNVSNLEWCTYSENTLHAYKAGLEKKSLGENHHAHILTEEKVKFIKAHYRSKSYNAKKLAEMLNVTESSVKDVIRGRTWRWLNEVC